MGNGPSLTWLAMGIWSVQLWQIMIVLLTMFRLPAVDWLSWKKVSVRETAAFVGYTMQAACSGLAQLEEGEMEYPVCKQCLKKLAPKLVIFFVGIWLSCFTPFFLSRSGGSSDIQTGKRLHSTLHSRHQLLLRLHRSQSLRIIHQWETFSVLLGYTNIIAVIFNCCICLQCINLFSKEKLKL